MPNWQLRDYQHAAFAEVDGEEQVIVNMPTGWGKSFLLCALAASDLRDRSRKAVICVPQRIIAKGFCENKNIELPDGDVVKWSVPRNLCGTSTAKVDALTDFLQNSPGASVASRVVITTHMTLSYALRRLSQEEVDDASEDTTFVIDEAHHILAAEHARNVLGEQIARLLDSEAVGIKTWLSTAYFFRGDHLPIISETRLSEFTRVHVPFDEYWQTLEHIESYSYDFVAYQGTVFEDLEAVLQENPAAPTLIYCPRQGHKMLLGKDKSTFVRRGEEIALQCLDAEPWLSYEDALQHDAVVIDLVETENRPEKIRFIADHGERIAAILTVGMFREGADWVQAAQIIDLVPTNSDQDRLQRFGRLVRDYPGKDHISYLSFFPLVVEQDEEERRLQLTKLYAHFHASLVLENAIDPIRVKIPPKRKTQSSNGKEDGEGDTRLNLLGEFPEKKQDEIIRDSYNALIKMHAEKDELGQTPSPEDARNTVVSALKEHGIKENVEPLAKQVLLLMRRRANVRVRTDDLVDAGFDKVWSSEILDPVISYSGGIGGPETLVEIRDVIERVFDQRWRENYEHLRSLPGRPDTQSSIYWWCTHNRTLYAEGELSQEKVKLLERIPWWTWAIGVSERWQTMFDKVQTMGSCPKSGTPEYAWVRQQRRLYQNNKLDFEKAELLETIAWWKWASLSSNWDEMFRQVAALPERPERGTKLYEWMRTQRKKHKRGQLEADRVTKLESISWWQWEERSANRDDGLADLRDCIEAGIALELDKSEVAEIWANNVGIKADQVHKYLRQATPEIRNQWKRLGDERGKRRKKLTGASTTDERKGPSK